ARSAPDASRSCDQIRRVDTRRKATFPPRTCANLITGTANVIWRNDLVVGVVWDCLLAQGILGSRKWSVRRSLGRSRPAYGAALACIFRQEILQRMSRKTRTCREDAGKPRDLDRIHSHRLEEQGFEFR